MKLTFKQSTQSMIDTLKGLENGCYKVTFSNGSESLMVVKGAVYRPFLISADGLVECLDREEVNARFPVNVARVQTIEVIL